jgi:hypothetical protein
MLFSLFDVLLLLIIIGSFVEKETFLLVVVKFSSFSFRGEEGSFGVRFELNFSM